MRPLTRFLTALSLVCMLPCGMAMAQAVGATVSGSVTVTSPTQGKFLIAHIDADNNICESNESNNIATRQIP